LGPGDGRGGRTRGGGGRAGLGDRGVTMGGVAGGVAGGGAYAGPRQAVAAWWKPGAGGRLAEAGWQGQGLTRTEGCPGVEPGPDGWGGDCLPARIPLQMPPAFSKVAL
jgi:hypothetical protein